MFIPKNDYFNLQVEFNKSYSSVNEEESRMKIFMENRRTISNNNKKFKTGNSTFRMGLNQFADMTFEEFSRETAVPSLSFVNVTFHPRAFEADRSEEIPASFDWRDFGAVSKVENQGNCGSCYAMAAVGSIESQLFIKTGISSSLSVQEVIDCARDYDALGCDGGIPFRVFDYVRDNVGISSDSNYRYRNANGECDRENYDKLPIVLKGYGEVASDDEDLLKHAVFKVGPILVAIDINHESFMRYRSGIYFEPDCSHEANHALLLVGYGNEKNVDYWIVKNSFGDKWGERGFMKIARNSESHCGIASEPIYPILD